MNTGSWICPRCKTYVPTYRVRVSQSRDEPDEWEYHCEWCGTECEFTAREIKEKELEHDNTRKDKVPATK